MLAYLREISVSTPTRHTVATTPGSPSVTSVAEAGAWVLLAVAAIALLVRVPSIAQPLGIDQSLWASAVRGLSRGQLLYQDVWEQRPPGIYLIYLAGFQLLGWTAATVAWLDVGSALLTTALLYAIARRLGGPLAAAATAAIYATLTVPSWLYKDDAFLWRSVCETFTPIGVATAALAAARLHERPSRMVAFVAGIALGATVVLKPNAALYAPAIAGWWLVTFRSRLTSVGVRPLKNGVRPPRGSDAPRQTGVSVVAAGFAAGCVVLPLLTTLWLWRLGVLADARVAVVDFNRWYVANGFTAGGMAVAFSKAVWLRMKTDPLWLAGGVGSVLVAWDLAGRRRLAPMASLAVWWGAAAACVIAVNGIQLFNSYFIQAMPPLALLTGWLLTHATRRTPARAMVAGATLAAMSVLLVNRGYVGKVADSARADMARLLGETPELTYLERFGDYAKPRGYSARANTELATYIAAHTTPEDRIFLFGINGAGVYFLADRLPAHRFLRVNFFVGTDFPDPAFRLPQVVTDLAARRPVYLIFERLHSASAMGIEADALPERSEVRALLEGYTFEAQVEDFAIYRRR